MEIQVQELVDNIKKDGIEIASREAAGIRSDAEAEAGRLLEAAKKEANDIVSRAKQDAGRSEKAGIAALEQASRNLVLAFKEEIQSLLNKLTSEYLSANYGEDVVKAALPDMLKSWAEKGDNNLSVILPENILPGVEGFFREKLNGQLMQGVEFKSNRKLGGGFHVSSRDGSVYYDFSAESVAGLLSAYLNPKLAEILKTSTKGM